VHSYLDGFTRPLQRFFVPEPVDPFGKASAFLREAASAKAGAELFDDGTIPSGSLDGNRF
jgi:hypothetical protein